jgi:hypothetical protein
MAITGAGERMIKDVMADLRAGNMRYTSALRGNQSEREKTAGARLFLNEFKTTYASPSAGRYKNSPKFVIPRRCTKKSVYEDHYLPWCAAHDRAALGRQAFLKTWIRQV